MEASSRAACPRVGGPSYDGKIAGLYDLEATLGRGHFAVVKLARHVFTGEKVAVKVIDKSKLDVLSKAHLFQEVRCMKLVQHPNVVRLYEVIDTQTKLYLVLELGDGGDLYDYIMKHEAGLSEPLAQKYFSQIVRAISYCHRLHVVHRDLKPENVVFFERSGVVKLTDFGFSNKFCPGQKLETSCGSLAYSAPEILLGDSYDAPAVDVWSLGVILFMLVAGQAPFQEANDSETLTMIMDCKYSVPGHVSPECRRLIGRMLVREPERRATLDEIAGDPWVRAGAGPEEGSRDLSRPLVSSRALSEADHAVIVQKMVAGNICTKEEIVESLEKNDYNYITATYYLLAERKLRSLDPVQTIPKSVPNKPVAPSLKVDSCNENSTDQSSTPSIMSIIPTKGPQPAQEINPRSRKCSIVTEDDEEESSGSRESGGLNRRGSRSEGKLHLAVQEIHRAALQINSITEASTAPGPLHPSNPSSDSQTPTRAVKTLPSPLSSLSSPQMGGGGGSVANNISRYERRIKLRKGSTASCSSSDASDEDSEGRNKRKGSSNSLHRGRGGGGPSDGGGGGGGTDGGTGGPGNQTAPGQNGTAPPPPSRGGRRGEGGGGTNAGNTPGVRGEGGRRRGETRLRESQSLNRITEVQEVEGGAGLPAPPLPPPPAFQDPPTSTTTSTPTAAAHKVHGSGGGGKRNALIGRYLMLQRKLCLPLLGRSRIYKAQDINSNVGSEVCQLHSAQGKCCSLC